MAALVAERATLGATGPNTDYGRLYAAKPCGIVEYAESSRCQAWGEIVGAQNPTWSHEPSISSPAIMRKIVVLPAPLAHTSPTFSPFWRPIEASINRIYSPCRWVMLSRRIMGVRAYWKAAATQEAAKSRYRG